MKSLVSLVLLSGVITGLAGTATADPHRFAICHRVGNGSRYVEIEVDLRAASAHLGRHGDVVAGAYYADADGDGYGDPASVVAACPGPGLVPNDGDCNDTDASVNPGAEDVCDDGIDNDCSGAVDEDCVGCAEILLHCRSNSKVMEVICGAGVHTLDAYTAANISWVRMDADVHGATLIHCEDGSSLSGDTLEIDEDTNLCRLDGGCCSVTRWNDRVCQIELF